MVLSLIFTGSLALLAGGGGHVFTKSHYQAKIRELEGRLLETQRQLAVREAALADAQAELARLRGRLADRDRRIAELAQSIAALRELAIDLRNRLASHESLGRRLLAAVTLRLGEHREQSEEMRHRLVETQRSLEGFHVEETSLQAEVIDLQVHVGEQAREVASARTELERTRELELACEQELKAVVGA